MKALLNLLLISAILSCTAVSQNIPSVHRGLKVDENGRYYFEINNERIVDVGDGYRYQLEKVKGSPKGSQTGIDFNFQDTTFFGTLYYGFIPKGDSKHPHPVYFRSAEQIEKGQASINIIGRMRGVYDMVNWQETGKGTLGYRVVNAEGTFLYDGKISFAGTGPFKVDDTIIEGPFVTKVTESGATIWYRTNNNVATRLIVNNETYKSRKNRHHEITVEELEPETEYEYTIEYGDNTVTFSFRTAPVPGTRNSFTFAYASDSRAGNGGGERNLYGANFYIMKKILALTRFKDARFMQFSGDLINGYLRNAGEMRLQYANWKRAVEPWGHYLPIYISMGNHEAYNKIFNGPGAQILVDNWPYATNSSESLFAEEFANPENGPESEDGAVYDPDPKNMDFPSYKENVFYYTYDNVAVIVLNSDYWYAPSSRMISRIGGGLHGYIMDQQLEWLEETVMTLEEDSDIDHVFVTQHTPCFPNGGHVRDDMWYGGNNQFRPWVGSQGLAKGIIERRDQILDILVNKSEKVIAIMTGDEHNYARTEIGPETNIYPEVYLAPKIELSRTIYQINNGAAGAPYYSQEETPWTPFVSGFTTQNALVFFHIEGESIEMEVLNPDTLEEVDRLTLR